MTKAQLVERLQRIEARAAKAGDMLGDAISDAVDEGLEDVDTLEDVLILVLGIELIAKEVQ